MQPAITVVQSGGAPFRVGSVLSFQLGRARGSDKVANEQWPSEGLADISPKTGCIDTLAGRLQPQGQAQRSERSQSVRRK